jgi:hypothetical protein
MLRAFVVMAIILASAVMITVFARPTSKAMVLKSRRPNVHKVSDKYKACMDDAKNDDEEVLCINKCIDLCGGDTAMDEDCLRICDGAHSIMR